MSVRFSLRFEGRSMFRLLGVEMCEAPGCENVVAIVVLVGCLHESVCLWLAIYTASLPQSPGAKPLPKQP